MEEDEVGVKNPSCTIVALWLLDLPSKVDVVHTQ